LRSRVRAAKRNCSAAAKGDADAIHDLRTSLRKVRAALSILSGVVVDEAATRKTLRKVERLFDALGDARDAQVLLRRLRRWGRSAGGKALRPLEQSVQRKRKRAVKVLARRLARKRGEKLLDALVAAARQGRLNGRRDPSHVRPSLVRHVAASTILRRFEAVLAFEVAIPGAAATFHRLRVAIKELRDALDFFGGALPPTVLGVDRTLGRAQKLLGDLHDHEVAREAIARAHRANGGTRELRGLAEREDRDAAVLVRSFMKAWDKVTSVTFRRAILRVSLLSRASPRSARAAASATPRSLPHASSPRAQGSVTVKTDPRPG
jgi:CHAD domain-containing protein